MRRSALGKRTILFCLLLACVMFGVSIFVPHDCCGEGCRVCLAVSSAKALFSGLMLTCALVLLQSVQSLYGASHANRARFVAPTPVTLRVVMRD